jgi:hypothetical protein
MGASRDSLIQRRANLSRRLAALRQHATARDPETGRSRIARAGGLIGGVRRAEKFGDARALGLALNLKRWHGIPVPPDLMNADT